MKTRCPACATIFRLDEEQLVASSGQVRCGNCATVFDAQDSAVADGVDTAAAAGDAWPLLPDGSKEEPVLRADTAAAVAEKDGGSDLVADGLLPRQTSELPGYSKWNEGAPAPTKSGRGRWLAALLVALLAVQLVFLFHGERVAKVRATSAQATDVDDSLQQPIELIHFERSDLQADPRQPGQLLLTATLANRAPQAQALPLLELTLLDGGEQVLARKVFTPEQYLAEPARAGEPFAGASEIALSLRLDAGDLAPAGYRLYVFHP